MTRKRTSIPEDVLQNAKTVRQFSATLDRRGLPGSFRLVATEIFRRWLNARRKGKSLVRAPVPDLMKKLALSESSVKRGLKAMRVTFELTPVAVEPLADGGLRFTRMDKPKGGFDADEYWLDPWLIAKKIDASEMLENAMRKAWADPPWKEPPPWRGVSRGVKGVSGGDVSEPDFFEQNHNASQHVSERRENDPDRGVTKGDFFVENQTHMPCVNDAGSLYVVGRVQADFPSSSCDASGEVACAPLQPSLPPSRFPHCREEEGRELCVPREDGPPILLHPVDPQMDPTAAHGRAPNGWKCTWTGRPVSPDQWSRLSYRERHGSTGRLWDAATETWQPGCNCGYRHPQRR